MTTLSALGLLAGGILGLGLIVIIAVGYVLILREEKKNWAQKDRDAAHD